MRSFIPSDLRSLDATTTVSPLAGRVDIDVPSDNHCWFWSVGLSWLLQAIGEAKATNQKAAQPPHTYPKAFAVAYGQLFGVTGQVSFKPMARADRETKEEKWEINDPKTIEAAYQMLLTYDGEKDTPNQFEGGILSQLICEVFCANLVRFMHNVCYFLHGMLNVFHQKGILLPQCFGKKFAQTVV